MSGIPAQEILNVLQSKCRNQVFPDFGKDEISIVIIADRCQVSVEKTGYEEVKLD